MKTNKYQQIVFFLICVILLFTACDSTTKAKTGVLSGKVALLNDTDDPLFDPLDFADVTVSVYDLAEYDADLRDFLSSYPNVGFALSQNSEFDHYEGKVVAKAISKEDGSFELKKVPVGKYNVVFEKPGWGYRYVYDVLISEGENQLTEEQELIELYPERYVSGTITESIVVENWHHLIIEDDANCMPQSSLSLGGNGILRINKNVQLNIYGNISLQGHHNNRFQVKLNQINDYDMGTFTHINLMPGSNLDGEIIEYGRFSGGTRGIGLSSITSALIRDCRFLVSNEGLYSTQVTDLTIEKCVFTGIDGSQGDGVVIYNATEAEVTNNCFMFLSRGVEVVASQEISFGNNGFIKVDYGIESYDTNSDIQHNNFEGNKISIRVAGTSSPSVLYNQINAEQGIAIGKNDYYFGCKPTINYNNMQCSRFFMTIVRPNREDINAKNNYYYTTDAQKIRNKIKHKPDYSSDQQVYIGNIIFEPFLNSVAKTAGII
jgi:hypothetical protein